METVYQQDRNSVKFLSEVEFQKQLKFGKRGYEHCAQTLERLHDIDKAVFDVRMDKFFKDQRARQDFIKDSTLNFKTQKKKRAHANRREN